MKRSVLASLVLVCLMGVTTLAWADEPQAAAGNQTTAASSQPGMEQWGKSMGKMMSEKGGMMREHMMKMMRPPVQMVASNDGGVIVLVGNKLVKYDKNLNVVKEAEIKGACCDMKDALCKMSGKHDEGKEVSEDKEEVSKD